MQASIVLDQTYPHYTNLDYISGKVHVRAPTSSTVANITVKLEGESRTRLLSPPSPNGERQKPQLEYHKILYQTEAVFPPPEIAQHAVGSSSGKTAYTLPAGQHEYPFRFKFPFNNSCNPTSNSNPTISLFGGLNVDMYKTPHQHVKKTLPPTLVGFPGEAEIRYYVKVTVNRPSIFKENVRSFVPFNFCPIEPPRPPPSDALAYARRKHQFNGPVPDTPNTPTSGKSKMASFFSSRKSGTVSSGSTTPIAPFVAVDMRIPEPAILTCAKPVPLRIIIASLGGVTTGLTISSLQVELVAITRIRAQDVGRTERSSTVLFSRSSMSVPLHFNRSAPATDPNAPAAKDGELEAEIDPRYWNDQPIPQTVPPSFEACNITRSYEVYARVGIQCDGQGSVPQTTIIELQLPVQVFSGITPPPELLEAMSQAQSSHTSIPSNIPTQPFFQHAAMDVKTPAVTNPSAAPPRPPRPVAAPPLPSRKPVGGGVVVQQPQATHQSGEEPPYGDAPPSYEDAVGANLQPAEGIRRAEYVPPTVEEDPILSSGGEGRGEKSGWH